MKNAERPKIVDKSDPRYFSIKTRGVRAFTTKADDGSDRFLIEGIASSSVTDRMGDILTETCQASMLSQARGLTMWLNHSYNVPEDIAGTCVDPTLQRATDDGGAACLDLAITLEVDPLNPRALQAWKSVDRGTRLAFSIGGYFKDFDFDADSFGLIVNDIELLEISLVGIPANPRAYTKAFEVATEALKAEVVKRAEAIISEHKSASEARVLVRKSFGLLADVLADVEEVEIMTDTENTVPDEQCAAEVPEILAASEDATQELIDAKQADEPIVKAVVTDEHQQAQIVECMKCIKNAVEAPGHQMCVEPQAHAKAAHSILKAMLPDEYGLPDDATMAAPAPVVLEIAPEKIAEFRAAWEAEMTKAGEILITTDADLKKISSEIEQLTAQKTALETENAELERKKAELLATPTGRKSVNTASNPGGSSKGSEPTIPIELYYKDRHELRNAAATK